MRTYKYILELEGDIPAGWVLQALFGTWVDRFTDGVERIGPCRYRLTLRKYFWPRHIADGLSFAKPCVSEHLVAIEDLNRHTYPAYEGGYRYIAHKEVIPDDGNDVSIP
jgi:hypothetical protein